MKKFLILFVFLLLSFAGNEVFATAGDGTNCQALPTPGTCFYCQEPLVNGVCDPSKLCISTYTSAGASDCATGETCCQPPAHTTIPVRDCGGDLPTAVGCLPVTTNEFVAWVLRFGAGAGGGIAFLLMVFGIFKIMTSSGDPKGIQAGKELITSAISGILLIIFSIFILQLIGVQILKIPGFG